MGLCNGLCREECRNLLQNIADFTSDESVIKLINNFGCTNRKIWDDTKEDHRDILRKWQIKDKDFVFACDFLNSIQKPFPCVLDHAEYNYLIRFIRDKKTEMNLD